MTESGIPRPETATSPFLNDQQREFVEHLHGSAMLHAPVGTGKTWS